MLQNRKRLKQPRKEPEEEAEPQEAEEPQETEELQDAETEPEPQQPDEASVDGSGSRNNEGGMLIVTYSCSRKMKAEEYVSCLQY